MTKILTIPIGQVLAREQLDMEKNTKFWVRVLLGLFDVWVVSAFKSRFVFGSSSVNVGRFWGSTGFDFFIDASVMD